VVSRAWRLPGGSHSLKKEVRELNEEKVHGGMDAFAHPEKVGQKVVVIGGGSQ